jgi:hypothetical protein
LLEARELSWGAILIAAAGAVVLQRTASARATFVTGLASAALLATGLSVRAGGPQPALLGLVAAGGAMASTLPRVLRRIPTSWSDAARTRPVATGFWIALALLTIVQVGRLGAYMTDDSLDWWITTKDPFWAKHQCFSAYVYAADLHAQGDENVYRQEHYPGVSPKAEPHPTVAHLDGFVDDPFQYPPHFLLLPKLALALTNDFLTIRTTWFALSFALFAGVVIALARWVGGREGRVAMLLAPLIAISPAALFNFQYGQFHFATILLAIAGLLAFESGRRSLGGALLAAAICAKIFPALLVVYLATQRRWKDLAWTGAFVAGFTGLAFLVLGATPFTAFVDYHLPRLANGDAFAFGDAWPDFAAALAAANQSPAGVVSKLEALGVAADGLLTPLNAIYSIAIVALAVWAGRRDGSRARRAQTWVALLLLASLRSPGAWGDYVPVPGIWLLTLLGTETATSARRVATLSIAWVLLFFLPGVVPTPVLPPLVPMMALSFVGLAALLAVPTWVLMRSARPAEAMATRS